MKESIFLNNSLLLSTVIQLLLIGAMVIATIVLCVTDPKKSFHKNYQLVTCILLCIMWLLVNTYSNYKLMSHIGTVNVFLFQYNEYFYGQGLIAYSKIFIALFLALYLILVFLILMILYSLSDNIKFSNEMISLITLLIIGGIFMIITSDVFVSFISLELMSLIIYVVIALDKSVSPSIESSVKYFILGSFVSTMSVSGICILYLILGTSELGLSTIIINCSRAEPFIYISGALIILLICALLFKLGVPPFHLWVADVYDGTSLPVIYFLATLPKITIIILFINLISMCIYPQYFSFFLALSGLLAIFVGSINALYQIKFKRFLAFSGIANLGYILLGLSALSSMGTLSIVFYLITYILNLTSLVYMMLTVRDDDTIKNVIESMVIKHKNYPLIILLALNFLSLAGIPPLLGFLPKLFLFIVLGDLGLYFGIVYTLFTSILMAICYSRIVRFLIIDEKWRDVDCVKYRRYFMFGLIFYFIILIVILMVVQTPIISYIF